MVNYRYILLYSSDFALAVNKPLLIPMLKTHVFSNKYQIPRSVTYDIYIYILSASLSTKDKTYSANPIQSLV